MALSADDLRQILADSGISTVVIGASILAAGVSVDDAYVVEHSTSWGVDDRWRVLRGRGR